MTSAKRLTELGMVPALAKEITSQIDSGTGLSQYIGAVATCGLLPNQKFAGATQGMSRTPHLARDNISQLQLVYPNFYRSDAGTETPAGSSAATIESSIEYPVGVFTRVRFGGGNQGSIPAGLMLTSDVVPVVIPWGAQFWIRSYYTNPDGVIYSFAPWFGTLYETGTGISNRVMGGGAAIPANINASYTAVAIIAPTKRVSFGLCGDSRMQGVGDGPDTTLSLGHGARLIGSGFAYVNLGTSGDLLVAARNNYTQRSALLAYCSHIISDYGINDIASGGQSAATVHAWLQTFYGLPGLVGKPIWQTTLEPASVTSTDGYTTEANQTVGANNAARITFNDTLRGGIAGIQGVIDTATILESPTSPGKWAVDNGLALTADGTHATRRGYLRAQSRTPIFGGMTQR